MSQVMHSTEWSERISSRFIRRALSTRSLSVRTTIPSAAGWEQEAARFFWPSTSTTHRRQELMGGTSSP